MKNRIERLRELLAQQSAECLLVTSEVNVRYLSGFTGDSSYLLVTADRVAILTDRRYETQIAQECADIESFVRGPEKTMLQLVAAATDDWSVKSLGLESECISWASLQQFKAAMPTVDFVSTQAMVESLRQIKDESEIEIIRHAVKLAQQSFLALRHTLKAGQSELEICHRLEQWMRYFGGSDPGFASIVAIGPNAALPHAQPGQRRIGDDPTLLVDWGVKYQGYTSDLTRTLCIGDPTPELAKIHPIVQEAQQAAIDAIRPGVELKTVDAAARDVIAAAGMGEYFGHGLGHGLGLQVHEAPRMSAITEGTLAAGMIVTVEPGIYLPGKTGVRIEDDVLVTENGHEVLSSLPKGLDDCRIIL